MWLGGLCVFRFCENPSVDSRGGSNCLRDLFGSRWYHRALRVCWALRGDVSADHLSDLCWDPRRAVVVEFGISFALVHVADVQTLTNITSL